MADPVTLGVTLALDAASMALTASQKIEGPRLESVKVTNADYGAPFFYGYGTCKNEGPLVIFAEDLREERHRNKTKGGKYNEYKYFGTWAVAIADHEIQQVLKIWFDEHVVYDATGAGPISPFTVSGESGSITDFMRIYLGTADQDPDPRMLATIESREGAGSCPAFRNVAYVMFEDLPLEKLGNRLPQVKVLFTSNGAPTYPYERFDSGERPYRLWGFAYSPDNTRAIWGNFGHYEIWDIAARAQMVDGTLASGAGGDPDDVVTTFGVANDGTIYTVAGLLGANLVSYPADGAGAQTLVTALSAYAESCQVVETGTGRELVMIAGLAPESTLQYWDIALRALIVDDTVPYLPTGFCVDAVGDVWIAGQPPVVGIVTTTDLYLNRLSGVGAEMIYHFGGLPASNTNNQVHIFHTGDHFVVSRNLTDLYIIDDTSMTITASRSFTQHTFLTAKQFRAVREGATSIWLSDGSGVRALEIDANDLSTIRSLDLDLWTGYTAEGFIYDPVNHAFIASSQTAIPAINEGVRWLYLDRASGDGVSLQSIVEDVAERCGLVPANDIDASALDQSVLGWSWTQGQGKGILDPLLETYNSEARPHNFELQFIKRGGAVQGAVAVGDMGAGGGQRYKIERTLDSDLPQRGTITFSDPAIDHQPNSVPSQRNAAATDSKRELSLDMSPWSATVDDARAAIDGYLRRQWFGAETYELSLTRAFTKLEPGDVWTLSLDSESKTARLTSLTFQADGVLALKWTRDRPSAHVASTQPGAPADGVIPPVIIAVGYTKGFVLDIPLVADSDDGIISYLAAGPYSSGGAWPGAIFYESDDGVDYADEYDTVPSDHLMTWGTASGVLADALPEVWDRASSVTVFVQEGALTSTSELAVANGANLALIGDEMVGFTTATLTAPNTYELSGFLRGRRGTEQFTGTHAAGDRFVLLDSALVRHLHGAGDVGDTFYVKPVTAGSASLAGFPEVLTYTAASAKPYSPAHLAVADDSGDLVLTWVRRTRIGGEWRDYDDAPLGEGSEAYQVDILDASDAVLRTYSALSTPTATYSAADQASDSGAGVSAKVYQISTTVGRGFPATVAL